MAPKLFAVLGIFILVSLIWWAGVKDMVIRKMVRRGLSKISAGAGLLTWGVLGASMLPREQFATIVEGGIFILGGVFILIGVVLRDQTQHDPRRLVGPSLRTTAWLLGERRTRHGNYEDQATQDILESAERYERESNKESHDR